MAGVPAVACGELRRPVRTAAAVATALLLACRSGSAPARPFPGSAVVISARIAPAATRVARVTASADGGAAVALRASSATGEHEGELVVTPGAHVVSIEARDARGVRVGGVAVSITAERGEAAVVAATLDGGGEPSAEVGAPIVASIVAPRASVVAGVEARVDAVLSTSQGGAATLSWSATPAGCAELADAASPSTRWRAGAAGTCTLTATARRGDATDRRSVSVLVRTRATAVSYPLRVASGGRFLVDRRGAPFLVKGEAAWLALANLTEEEQELYLSDRAARGFDLVEVMLMNHDYTGPPSPVPPANRYGEAPFLAPGDLSRPNDAYFDRVVRFVDRAATHGIAVLLAPSYLGFDGGREGWWEALEAPGNDRATCFRFGRYVGARLADRANVVWLAGGDFAPPSGSEGEARHLEIVRGIRAAGARQPWTGHWNLRHQGGISTDAPAFRARMDLNGVYQYASPWRFTARAYGERPPRPVFLLESTYEHEHPASEHQPFRKAWWWSMTSGGTGLLAGNLFVWMAESARGTYRAAYGDADGALSSWRAELDSAGTHEVTHLHALFEALPWWRLVPAGAPSGLGELVVVGRGARQAHVAAAASRDGDLLVAYVPPTGAGSRALALDLSRMRAPARVRWFDPTVGAFVGGRAVAPSRRVFLETPGANAAGANDWVLVAEGGPPDATSHGTGGYGQP